jgi:D-alanyl-D-alanine carboxypeptidase
MLSTVGDLRTWAEALATGTLLSPELQAERLDFQMYPRVATPIGEQQFGYGLGVLTFNGFIGHNGGILGYSSWMVYEPRTGSTIVVVTNRASTEGGTADGIFIGIARLLFPDHFPAAAPVATPVA